MKDELLLINKVPVHGPLCQHPYPEISAGVLDPYTFLQHGVCWVKLVDIHQEALINGSNHFSYGAFSLICLLCYRHLFAGLIDVDQGCIGPRFELPL